MTISLCWRRKFLGVDEIIFASDSRLSAGYRWDCAQKIFPIEGPNFCISFAGAADFAFPCIFQFQGMVRNYRRFTVGAAPIGDITGDFVAICNQMHSLVDDRQIAQFNQTQFIIGGYDFERGEPYQRIVSFDKASGAYRKQQFGGLRSGGKGFAIGFVGDYRHEYFAALGNLIAEQKTELNFQPLEALKGVLEKHGRNSSIGGVPQVVKVYRHRNYLPYAVQPSAEEQEVFLFGRPLLEYERTFYPVLRLDRFGSEQFVTYPHNVSGRVLAPPPALSNRK